jgi:GntR family transcriptional regulator
MAAGVDISSGTILTQAAGTANCSCSLSTVAQALPAGNAGGGLDGLVVGVEEGVFGEVLLEEVLLEEDDVLAEAVAAAGAPTAVATGVATPAPVTELALSALTTRQPDNRGTTPTTNTIPLRHLMGDIVGRRTRDARRRCVYYKSMTSSRFSMIAHDLRERVALGDVGVQGALESETELCTRYGVSRPTVRRALDLLRDEGLVHSRHGAGWFVTGTAFHQRLALGTFRHADSAVTESGRTVCREVAEFSFRPAPGPVATILQIPVGAPALHVRSARRVDGESLDVAHEWVPELVAGHLAKADAADPGLWASLTRAGHAIATVRQTITAGLATVADAELLRTTVGVPLLLVRRVALAADGTPLALSDHRYLAHRFALEVEFNSGPSAGSPETPGLRAVAATP